MAVLVPAVGDLEELPVARRQAHAEAFLVARDLGLTGTRRAEPGSTAESVVRTPSPFGRNGPVLGEVLLGPVVHGPEKVVPGVAGGIGGRHGGDPNGHIRQLSRRKAKPYHLTRF